MTSQNDPPAGEDEEETEYEIEARGGRWPLMLALVCLAAGLASVLFLASAQSPGESSVETGFARDMAVHHSQATEMAEIVRRYTQDDSLYALASEIVLLQQLQIGQIRGWLALWDLPEEGTDLPMTWMGHPTSGLMPGMASAEQISRLEFLPQAEMEAEFLRLMIPHHQSGVAMAEEILNRTRRPEVRKLAHDILGSQGPEILLMQDMLTRRGLPQMPETLAMPGMSNGDGATDHEGSGHTAGSASAPASASNDLEVGAVARKTLQFVPWTLAAVALAWLFLRAFAWQAFDEVEPVSIVQSGAAIALLAGGAIQAGFIVGQLPAYSAYAFIAALAAAVAAAALLGASPVRLSYFTGLVTSFGLIALYVVSRIVVPLEAGAAEGSALAGVASVFAYFIALVICAVMWLATQGFEPDDEQVA